LSLYEQIKADRIAAMKAGRTTEKDLLGTLASAAARESKTPDDGTVVRTVRAFLKSNEETAAALRGRGQPTEQPDAEAAILRRYLPTELDRDALEASIEAIIAELDDRSPKAMGKVMAELKARHGDAVNMKDANALVRTKLG
jgi:uncharacterized protein YqeY